MTAYVMTMLQYYTLITNEVSLQNKGSFLAMSFSDRIKMEHGTGEVFKIVDHCIIKITMATPGPGIS